MEEVTTDASHVSVHESGGERGRAEKGRCLLLSLDLQSRELCQKVRLFFVKPGTNNRCLKIGVGSDQT